MGFEALSRGAAQAVFIESAAEALACIRRNAKDFGVESEIRSISEAFPRALARLETPDSPPFDLILADPPYRQGWEEKILDAFARSPLLAVGGKLFIEWAFEKGKTLPDRVAFLVKVREKSYGDTVLTTYSRTDHEGTDTAEDLSSDSRDPGDLSGLV